MYYLIVLLATVMMSFEFVFTNKYQANEGANLVSGLKFNALTGLFTAIIFFCFGGFKIELSVFSLIMATIFTVSLISYIVIGMFVLKKGGMAVYSLFLMSGGMLLPYFFGVLFLNEGISVYRIIGVSLILSAVIISNRMKNSFSPSFYILCTLIFIFNGFVNIASKYHQVNTVYYAVDNASFVMYSGITKFIISSIALLFCKKDKKILSLSKKSSLPAAIGASAVCGLSFLLQLIGAKELPATVLYPLITGGTIVFSAISGIVFFKEKISRSQFIAIFLCVVGTLFFL